MSLAPGDRTAEGDGYDSFNFFRAARRRARPARRGGYRSCPALLDSFEGKIVVGHADWRVNQMRFEGQEVAVVYDWDSLRPEKEVVIVGIASSNFTSTGHAEVPNPPSPVETRLFIRDYESARGAPFSVEERRAITGAAIYAIAYIARCEYALDREGHRLEGSFREVLPVHAGAYCLFPGTFKAL